MSIREIENILNKYSKVTREQFDNMDKASRDNVNFEMISAGNQAVMYRLQCAETFQNEYVRLFH